jgi:hypothetical protein
MHYIICPIRPAGAAEMEGTTSISDKVARDCLKRYHTDKEGAIRVAQQLAAKHPQVQFAIFEPLAIFETLPPPPPQVIRKRFNSNGEIVLDKGE